MAATAALMTLDGGDEDDVLIGGAGNDALDAGAGNDAAEGNAGKDRVTGSTGDDRVGGGVLVRVAHRSARYWWTSWTAAAPSPTAEATRLTDR
jgi:hypothetical protein